MAPSVDQEKVLKEFESKIHLVKRPGHQKEDLIKWLSARNYDVKKAADMYQKSMIWRQENNVDDILEQYQKPEVVHKYYAGGLFGESRDGLPLWIDMIGRIDIRGMMLSVKRSELLRYMIYNSELLQAHFKEVSAKHGHRIDQCVHIIDMEGFGTQHMWKPCLDFYIETITMLESNYPETLKTTYIINAPKVFHVGYKILKTFIDKGTAEKFVVLDRNWHDTVFSAIDPSQIPAKMGGTCKDSDGDPACSSKMNWGGPIPNTFYRSREDLLPPEKWKVTQVRRGGKLEMDFSVQGKGALISYLFSTEDKPLKFGIERRIPGSASESEVIRPVELVSCHMVPEDGSLVCDIPATYVLVFDNTDNWLTFSSLTLWYYVDVNDRLSELSEQTEEALTLLSEL